MLTVMHLQVNLGSRSQLQPYSIATAGLNLAPGAILRPLACAPDGAASRVKTAQPSEALSAALLQKVEGDKFTASRAAVLQVRLLQSL